MFPGKSQRLQHRSKPDRSLELEGDVGGNLEHSSRIQCAVLYYSLTDVLGNGADLAARFSDRARTQDAPGGLTAQLLGIKDPRGMAPAREVAAKGDTSDPNWKAVELSRLSDPVRYVTKGAPPILLAHSSIDNVVAVEQSERLYGNISSTASTRASTCGHGARTAPSASTSSRRPPSGW